MDLDDDELRATKILHGVYDNVYCNKCAKFPFCKLAPKQNCDNFIKRSLDIDKIEFTEWVENRNENIKE